MFFLSPRNLRGPFADRRETLPHDRKLAEFYNASPKNRGTHPPPQKNGVKTYEISVDFIPLKTLIVNISGTRQDIQNRKDVRPRAIPPACEETGTARRTSWQNLETRVISGGQVASDAGRIVPRLPLQQQRPLFAAAAAATAATMCRQGGSL